jgi:hypothetical protein
MQHPESAIPGKIVHRVTSGFSRAHCVQWLGADSTEWMVIDLDAATRPDGPSTASGDSDREPTRTGSRANKRLDPLWRKRLVRNLA